ncbi:MAG: hypothetical protein MUP82_08400, partial [Candidatus Marinimicrobia bacterium]|nr:hypothetical protein [Candidatus Neomarinimicrobiota bacterium]
MAKICDLLIAIFLISSQVFSQNIETKLIKGLPSNLSPGSSQTIVFRISNQNNYPISLNAKLSAPTNWRLFFNETVTIQENSITILPIGMMIPLATQPGFYQIILELHNSDKNYKKVINVDTRVLNRIDIEIKLVDAPKFSIAGRELSADFSIYNKSNIPCKILLQSSTCSINGAENTTLDIGESKVINVICSTDPNLKVDTKQLIDLSVSSGSFQNDDKTYVTVVPAKSYSTDKYHRLPSKISAMYLYRNSNLTEYNGFQGEFYSRGSLDPENKHHLEISARGPDQFDNTTLGLYDEYYLNYNSTNFQFFIGDDTYSLTPLTEFGRYGTGILAGFKNKNYDLGLFYMEPRFFPDYKQEIAGYFNYNFDKNSLGLAYLQKIIKDSNNPINLYSALYTINPLESLSMDVEYSIGKSEEEIGQGFSVELINSTNKTATSGSYIMAGKNFPGYYNNTSYLNGNFQWIIDKNLRLFTNFHQDESNAQRDTLYGVSPYSQYFTAGLAYSFRTQDYININIGKRERKDRMPLKKFHYSEDFLRVALVNNFRNVQTNISSEIANTINYLTNSGGNSYKGSMSLRYRPIASVMIGSFFHYYDTYRYSENSLQEFIYGAETSYNINSQTRLSVSFQNSHNIEEYYHDRSLIDIRFATFIHQNHEINFNWSESLKQKQIDNRDRFIGLKYTFHFGIPLKKTKELGSLHGQLINKGVKDIGNVILNLGGRIQASNEDGLFIFPDVIPGDYYLYIDPYSMEFTDIPNVKIPMTVSIKPDSTTDIQIELTKACAIFGSVLLDFEDIFSERLTQNEDNVNQKNVIIELQLDDEFHRTVVNLNDKFIFTGLRPGAWKLKVYHNSLGN